MFPRHLFNKTSYFINPFGYLFREGFGHEGGSVAIVDKLLKEDSFDLLQENGDRLLLE